MRKTNTLKEYYPLIGKIVVKFQELDFSLNLLMVSLLKEDPNVTMAYAVSLSFSKKIDVLKSIAPFKLKYQDFKVSLDEIIRLLSEAEAKRNRIVHGTWFGNISHKDVYFHKPRTSRKHGLKNGGVRSAPIKELEDSLAIIQQAFNSVVIFGRGLEERKVIVTHMFQELDVGQETVGVLMPH